MIFEALFISLIISIGLFFYEFFKMKSIFQNVFQYNQFFSGFGSPRLKLFDTMNKKEGDIGTKLSGMEKRFYGIDDRLSKQENVIEKIIKEISGING